MKTPWVMWSMFVLSPASFAMGPNGVAGRHWPLQNDEHFGLWAPTSMDGRFWIYLQMCSCDFYWFIDQADSHCLLGNLWHHRVFEVGSWADSAGASAGTGQVAGSWTSDLSPCNQIPSPSSEPSNDICYLLLLISCGIFIEAAKHESCEV